MNSYILAHTQTADLSMRQLDTTTENVIASASNEENANVVLVIVDPLKIYEFVTYTRKYVSIVACIPFSKYPIQFY